MSIPFAEIRQAYLSAALLVLVDLPPGTYAIVCLLTDEEGLPYLASGMAAAFTVE